MTHNEDWTNLQARRARRSARRAQRGEHPIAHVNPDKCYEWMRADTAALDLARQGREDSLIQTITQISSGALLAIPGLIFGSDAKFPPFRDAHILYIGILGFLVTLLIALLEQFLSGMAYNRQKVISQQYYAQKSERTSDTNFIPWVRRTRHAAIVLFVLSVIFSAIALMRLERTNDGKSSASASAASASTPAASTPAAAASTAASATPSSAAIIPGVRAGRLRGEIRSGGSAATPAPQALTH